ncbi:MAG TPA: Ig-like domain-containing protein [Solirubrobacteraceae bacterium]|nr:Ig-like domain-containing protein [Solirubrobacteraceae bacterium]
MHVSLRVLRRMLVAMTALAALVIPATAVLAPATASAAEPLSPFLSVSGEHLALSVDALGTNNPEGGPIKVQKSDAGETVRAAYLFAASTGETNYIPKNGDVTLDGEAIEWEAAHTISSDIGSYNAVANVTSIVKPVVDAAATGLVSFTVAEGSETFEYDGEILVVVLEDPAVNEARSLTLLYGAQNPLGDTFHVGLAEPIDKSNPKFALNLSLGISYGYQPTGQYSIVKVNEKLMTSSAGGQDDCVEKYSLTPDWAECGNGTLITAGGIGDSIANPPNPEATDLTCENEAFEKAPRCDDELYSLLPFVSNGESAISFSTDNPSDNDNIFFGALEVHGGAAIVGEGITLAPASGTNQLGESHTVTATVQDEHGEPVNGAVVHFQVTSGPNAGLTGEGTTSSGKAQFTYSSSKTGTDHISAYFTNGHETKYESNGVSETWEEAHKESSTTTTTPAVTPKSGVLAFGPTGSARLASNSKACVASTGYLASVSGKLIASVTFTLDGHKLKTLTKANSHGAFALRVGVKAGHAHHLTIKVTFTSASSTKSLTINRTLARCAAVHVTAPRFTG